MKLCKFHMRREVEEKWVKVMVDYFTLLGLDAWCEVKV